MIDNTSCKIRGCNKCDEYKKHCDDLMQENEALRMRLAEIRDKVDEMEPPEGFPSVYNHAYYEAKEEVRRIIK